MSLNKYVNELNRKVQKLSEYQLSEFIEIDSKIKIDQTVIVNIKIVLIDCSELYIREYVNNKYGINRIDYSYQYQSIDKILIFRYDNSKHKPPLGCSDHKHQKDGSIIPCQMPTIDDIIEEVIDYLAVNI